MNLFCFVTSLEVTDRPSTDPGTAALLEFADNVTLLALWTLVPSLCFPDTASPKLPWPAATVLTQAQRKVARWLLLRETAETSSDVRGKTLLPLALLGRSGTVCPTSSLCGESFRRAVCWGLMHEGHLAMKLFTEFHLVIPCLGMV